MVGRWWEGHATDQNRNENPRKKKTAKSEPESRAVIPRR